MSNVLNKEAILGANDRETKTVPVPAWGGSVRIRKLSAYHAERLSRLLRDGADGLVTARAVAWSLVDDHGNLLFSEAEIEALAQKNGKILDALFREIDAFNSDQVTIEDEAKNS